MVKDSNGVKNERVGVEEEVGRRRALEVESDRGGKEIGKRRSTIYIYTYVRTN